MEDVKASLAELGLSTKESVVYLSMLELGPSSVQDISKKAGVNRSTTYVMIEGLKRHGLISTFEKGKKLLFSAENPGRLMSLVEEEMAKVRAKQDRVSQSLPRLLAIFNAINDKPRVRFFEGDEALMMAREEMIEKSSGAIWEVYAADEISTQIGEIREEHRMATAQRISIKGRTLVAIKPGFLPNYFDLKASDVREMPYEAYPFSGSVVITNQRVYLFSPKVAGLGVIMESREMVEMMRALYEAIWRSAKPWVPPSDWGMKK